MSDRRNPYLILGIDHGADATTAARAFARVSRRVRSDADAPYSLEDVTWALHSIEQAEEDPEASLDVFRVPADASVYLESELDTLLPAPRPLERTTPNPGSGREIVEASAVARQLRDDLQRDTLAALADPIPPRSVDRQTPARTPPRERVRPAPRPAPDTTVRDGSIPAWVWVAAILLVLLAVNAYDDDDGVTDAPSTDAPSDVQQVQPWITVGTCLTYQSDDAWQPGPCSGHDAEIISTSSFAVSEDVCTRESDMWFSDDWGVYCAMVITDDTPEGGHWGIGPVDDADCIEVDEEGSLVGKTLCDGDGIPVMRVARDKEECDVTWARGTSFVYWEAADGTSNYLCVDGYHWEQAGLPLE